MGEWQKSLGEQGESIVASLFDILGWRSDQKGIDIKCNNKKHLGEGGNPREKHGIDYLFSYRSPLSDDLCDNLAVSVKFQNDDYPSTPTKFKGFYSDLIQFLACYPKSDEYKLTREHFKECKRKRNIGVIFWLNRANAYSSHKSVIENIDIPQQKDEYDAVYFVDNKTASFIYETTAYVKSRHPTEKALFSYFDTGQCTNIASREYSGPLLPIEYLNLGLLPVKIASEHVLYLSCDRPFSEEHLARQVGLSQSMSQDWPSKIILLYPDYDPLKHDSAAGRVLASFKNQETAKKVELDCVKQSFLSNGR